MSTKQIEAVVQVRLNDGTEYNLFFHQYKDAMSTALRMHGGETPASSYGDDFAHVIFIKNSDVMSVLVFDPSVGGEASTLMSLHSARTQIKTQTAQQTDPIIKLYLAKAQ
jgi:hypothetical protein